MSDDIHIRKEGRAGRITLTRTKALNALSYEMCLDVEAALDSWRTDPDVAVVLMDAEGERAFCAGGDIGVIYETGMAQDFEYGRKFWADEYRMNAKIFTYPKPVISLMQGFTMGGGVGLGCHGSHRVVGETSQIAMPEVGIGLVPDVGGSLILALAPGRLGEYLGTTAARMGPADAIYAGFADQFIPQDAWPALIDDLVSNGDATAVERAATTPPDGTLQALQPQIDAHFAGQTLGDIARSLQAEDSEFAAKTLKSLSRNSPLAMACAVELVHRQRGKGSIQAALAEEYRFTYRAAEQSDLLEGIRAKIIDKDNAPNWRHSGLEAVSGADVTRLMLPLGKDELNLTEEAA
ncbi:3-hydroxyisobutyrate dehydrogenase [Actibacterium atlanticum]|uniref:3-hydroxyisobutyryl-CoA hydrolase n=1 Tax=Actibacterium atlanticum TaxID=1461693 RepID=A0A058ZRA2_9RHOB|nr:enoyl-CoA hydratase/isomerase family protein [Actibacterium atlanticum]KCV83386.1 3-hydroxyisobutyrate dehydrogenase [Actibacterium atlanticum]